MWKYIGCFLILSGCGVLNHRDHNFQHSCTATIKHNSGYYQVQPGDIRAVQEDLRHQNESTIIFYNDDTVSLNATPKEIWWQIDEQCGKW